MALKRATDAALDALATIRAQDIDAAVAAYDRDASPAMRGLLDAAPAAVTLIDRPLALGKPLPPVGI